LEPVYYNSEDKSTFPFDKSLDTHQQAILSNGPLPIVKSYIRKMSSFKKSPLKSKYNETWINYMLIIFDVNSTLYTMDPICNLFYCHWIIMDNRLILSYTIDQFWAVFMMQFICDSNFDWLKVVPKLRSFVSIAQVVVIQIENEYSIL